MADATTIGALKVTVDTSALDVALEKAERLKATLQDIRALGVDVDVVAADDKAAKAT